MSAGATSVSIASTTREQQLLADQTQLDEILQELLGDEMLRAPTPSPDKPGTSRTVMSWGSNEKPGSVTVTQRTVKTPVHMDGPNESVHVEKREVTERSYSMPQQKTTYETRTLPVQRTETYETRVGPNTSYTTRNIHETKKYETTKSYSRPRTQSDSYPRPLDSPFSPIGSPPPPPPRTYGSDPYREYASDTEGTWLMQQQRRLKTKKTYRTEQEKQLVAELRNAQDSFETKKAVNRADENAVWDKYSKPTRDTFSTQNGPHYGRDRPPPRPVSPAMSDITHAYSTEKKYYVSGLERPPFTTNQTKYTFSISPPKRSQSVSDTLTTSYDRYSRYGNYGRSITPNPTPPPRSRSLQRHWDIYDTYNKVRDRGNKYSHDYDVDRMTPREPPREPIGEQFPPAKEPPVYVPPRRKSPPRRAPEPEFVMEDFIQKESAPPKPKPAYELDDLEKALEDAMLQKPKQKPVAKQLDPEVIEPRRRQPIEEPTQQKRQPPVEDPFAPKKQPPVEEPTQPKRQPAVEEPIDPSKKPPVEQPQEPNFGPAPVPVTGQLPQPMAGANLKTQQQSYQYSWETHGQWGTDQMQNLQVPTQPEEEEIEVDVISLQPIGSGIQNLEPERVEGVSRPVTPAAQTTPAEAVTPAYTMTSPAAPVSNQYSNQFSNQYSTQYSNQNVNQFSYQNASLAVTPTTPTPSQTMTHHGTLGRTIKQTYQTSGTQQTQQGVAPVGQQPIQPAAVPVAQMPVQQPMGQQGRPITPHGMTTVQHQQVWSQQQVQGGGTQPMFAPIAQPPTSAGLGPTSAPLSAGPPSAGPPSAGPPSAGLQQAQQVQQRQFVVTQQAGQANQQGTMPPGGSASVITPTGSLPLQDGTFREQQVTTSAQVHGVPAGVQQQHQEAYSTQQRQNVRQVSQGSQSQPGTLQGGQMASMQGGSSQTFPHAASAQAQGGSFQGGSYQQSGSFTQSGGNVQQAGVVQPMPLQQLASQQQHAGLGGQQFQTRTQTVQQEYRTVGGAPSQMGTLQSQTGTLGPQGTQTVGLQNQQFSQQQQQQQPQAFGQQHQQQVRTQQQYYTQQQNVQQQQHGMVNGSATLPMQHGQLAVETNRQFSTSSMPRSPGSTGSQLSPQSPGSVQVIHEQFGSMNRSGATTPAFPSGTLSPLFMGTARRGSQSSDGAGDGTPRFVRDTSKYWYKSRITREEAIVLLKDKEPGTFVVRDSNSFPGAFGLAVKVAQLPPNIHTKPGGDPQADLVRHFLIEPTNKGVKLKGCSNEPVFASLAALVYQHSITPLALPCRLILPEMDPSGEDMVDGGMPTSAQAVLAQGAACNVLYISSLDTESLTGREAIAKAINLTFNMSPPPKTTMVHFKVASQGITLTDNRRKLFFRRHYPIGMVSYAGLDPEDRRWSEKVEGAAKPMNARIFGFVARKQGSLSGNQCHLFAELDPDQPATAIVNFIQKVFISLSKQQHA